MGQHHDPGIQARLRALLAPIVATGESVCGKCGNPIDARARWDAGHRTDLARNPHTNLMTPEQQVLEGHVRPEHRSCNRRAGATNGNIARGKAKARLRKANEAVSLGAEENSALFSGDSPQRGRRKAVASRILPDGVQVPVQRPKVSKGLVQPRYEWPTRKPRAKSLGAEAAAFIESSGMVPRGQVLYPWQRHALDRILELNPDGTLRFQTIVLTISRQQGKSVLARGYLWWRIHQGDRFGEEQVVVHVANRIKSTREVWRPAARVAQTVYDKNAAKFGKGEEQLDLSEWGHGRWLCQAANEDTAIGFSIHGGLVDEAWNVKQEVVDDAMTPAMSAMEQPQLVLVSTAGIQDASDLLRSYRDAALADTDGTGDVLLLEWSAPPEAAWDDPNTWRWASPHWDDRRAKFLASTVIKAKAAGGEAAFRRQYLNQWTAAEHPWIPATVWAQGYTDAHPEGPPKVVAVEASPEFDRYGLVAAWEVEEGTAFVEARVCFSTTELWRIVDEYGPRRLLLPPGLVVHYKGRRRPKMVGTREITLHLGGVQEAIREGRLLHGRGDNALDDDIARAIAVAKATGYTLTNRMPGERMKEGVRRPIECARAMVWAVGETVRLRRRPMIGAA